MVAQVAELHKVVEGVVQNEQNVARARDEKMALLLDDIKGEVKEHVDDEIEKTNALVRELRLVVEGQNEQGDLLASQFAEFQRHTHVSNQTQLDALEKRLLDMLSPSLDAVSELQQNFNDARAGNLGSSGVFGSDVVNPCRCLIYTFFEGVRLIIQMSAFHCVICSS